MASDGGHWPKGFGLRALRLGFRVCCEVTLSQS